MDEYENGMGIGPGKSIYQDVTDEFQSDCIDSGFQKTLYYKQFIGNNNG